MQRKDISVADLELDPQNPRLIVGPKPSQADLLRSLFDDEGLEELVPSFLENGFFQEEPLVVVPAGSERFRVVEGNRRLATLKLLHDESLRRKIGAMNWPKLSQAQRASLERVPCIVYPKRDLVIPFLGYRHITGARKWGTFQKSRFVAQLLEAGESLDHIQDLIGDTTQATKKLYQNYVVYQQIEQDLDDFPTQPIRERFSLLEVALGQRPIKNFLGMPKRLPAIQTETIVPDDRIEALREVVRWIYGDSDRKAVITESREITGKLSPVLESEEAVKHLRATNDLEAAYERSGGELDYVLRRLGVAERAIQNASSLIALYATDGDIRAAIRRLAKLVEGMGRQTSE